MPDFNIRAGDTDATIYVRLRDSTTGLAKTGLAYNSTGAVCSYVLPRAARAAITLATQTVTGAHSDGGFVEVDATNCKGLYRLDLPDAAIASGAYTIISIEFDGIIEESVEIPLANAVNVTQISGDGTAADNAESFFDGTGYAGTNNTIPTVTNVTNLHASAATAAELAKVPKSDGTATWNATALASINAEADTAISDASLATAAALATVDSNVDTLLTRITSTLFSGITSLAEWLGMIAGKQAGDATALTEIRGTGAGSGAFDPTTDSGEALRDRGDAAWITATGFSTHSAADVWAAGTRTLTGTQAFNLTGDITGNLSGSVGSVTGNVGGSVASVTGNVGGSVASVTGGVGGNLTGTVGGLAAQAKADVNAEVVDALATDTYGEPTGVPGATVTLSAKVGYLYMALRNGVTITSTKKQFLDDGGAAEWEKDLSDDGTTYAETKGNAP